VESGVEHLFSDHRYIEFTITVALAENITNLKLTNWGYYKKLLTRNLHNPPTHVLNGHELDKLVNTFTDICSEAIKKVCPSRTVITNQPWQILKASAELTSIELSTTTAKLPETHPFSSAVGTR